MEREVDRMTERNGIIDPHGGYRELRSYQIAEIVIKPISLKRIRKSPSEYHTLRPVSTTGMMLWPHMSMLGQWR